MECNTLHPNTSYQLFFWQHDHHQMDFSISYVPSTLNWLPTEPCMALLRQPYSTPPQLSLVFLCYPALLHIQFLQYMPPPVFHQNRLLPVLHKIIALETTNSLMVRLYVSTSAPLSKMRGYFFLILDV